MLDYNTAIIQFPETKNEKNSTIVWNDEGSEVEVNKKENNQEAVEPEATNITLV